MIVLNATLVGVTYMVLLERKVIAWAQSRLGPMRVGPYGILQPIADALKLMIKEDITPVRADKWVFTAAPIISMVPALIVYAVIPFGPEVTMFGRKVTLFITDINVGLLYIVSVASVGVYGIILAGWSSNSKYPLLASLRASAQLISYEVAVTLTLVSVIMMAGTLSMVGIVQRAGQPAPVVRVRAAGGVRPGAHRRARRNQSRAVRSARGGAGAHRRLPHRIQRHAVRAVLPRRIREHDRHLVGGHDAVPGRVAAAVSEHVHLRVPLLHPELDVVFDQVVRVSVSLHLDSRDAAAVPLRPADAARMEGPDSGGDRESGRHGHREGAALLLIDMGEAIAFYTLAAFILGFAVLVVSTKNTVHSVLFLVMNFLFVAALYVLLGAQFLAVIQILVYAGGIVVLYLFVVMLVNLKRPPEAHQDPHRRGAAGFWLSAAVLAELVAIGVYGYASPPTPQIAAAGMPVTGNTEQVGWLLYTSYLIPFEIASMLLLVAMIGAIVLAKQS